MNMNLNMKLWIVFISMLSISCSQGISTMDTSLLPEVTFSNLEVTESATARIPIRLSTPANETVTIEYTTIEGSGKQGVDYQLTSGTLTIEKGNDSGFVDVPTIEDSLNENPETFKLVISNANNANISQTSMEVTIADNDPLPNLSIADVSANEANNVTVTITLDAPSGRDIFLDLETQNISATAGVDYSAFSRTDFVIPAGQTTASISTPFQNDLIDEIDETFKVVITKFGDVNVVDNTSIVTITDDDAAPVISVTDTSVTEGKNQFSSRDWRRRL